MKVQEESKHRGRRPHL